jgi:hypothetical protein
MLLFCSDEALPPEKPASHQFCPQLRVHKIVYGRKPGNAQYQIALDAVAVIAHLRLAEIEARRPGRTASKGFPRSILNEGWPSSWSCNPACCW